MRKIAILGATGSIGTQTLSVLREHRDIEVVAMSCGRNVALFEKQIREFSPAYVAVADEAAKKDLALRIADCPVPIGVGLEGLIETATFPEADMVLTAIVGMLGIRPTIAAICAGKDIALANKETLVCAGSIIMPLAKEKGVSILPVDSEHSAIFQSLQGNRDNPIAKILLTASGGPFRGRSRLSMETISVEEALAHPNWNMGKKISIDSATMVNKSLEVMEAAHLFGVGADRIEVVVHPESIVHSAVEFEDGSVIAQLGCPDMRLPIQYALYYPKRRTLSGEKLDLFKVGRLTFEKPDFDAFPGLSLGLEAFRQGGTMPTVFNAANEKAVSLFLERRISFLDIPRLIEKALAAIGRIDAPTVEDILDTEQQTYRLIETLLS